MKLLKQTQLHAGDPGAPLLAHERSRWLHLQQRKEPTQEWKDAMCLDGGYLLKYLQPPKYFPGQMEAVCKVCSDPKNAKYITSGNKLAEFMEEPAPKYIRDNSTGGLKWVEAAWF